MKRRLGRLAGTHGAVVGLLGAGGLALGLLAPIQGAAVAGAATTTSALPGVCRGTPGAPGVLAGTHPAGEMVEGACTVNGGPALVRGNLTLAPGAVLLAAFGLDDHTHGGHSSLTVTGNLLVERGATLLLGCKVVHGGAGFPCLDDPNPKHPTLTSSGHIGGSLLATQPFAVVVHNSTIGGSIRESGGGGGLRCVPAGPFLAQKVPVYSDYEDSTIGGNVDVSGLASCWLGFVRDHVHGTVSFVADQLADPDAIEINSNAIGGNLVCHGNSRVWDSAEKIQNKPYPRIPAPNTVSGTREGQCVLASPPTPGGKPGPGAF